MKKQYLTLILCILIIPAALQARDFLNTVVHLNFGGMYTFSSKGDILDAEKKEAKSKIYKEVTDPDTGEVTRESTVTNVSHYETAYFATLDIVPFNPIILGLEENAVKFGIRGSYSFHYLQQKVSTDTEIGEQLMEYRSWMIGPVIHFAPFIEPSDLNDDYTASGGFTLYALYGKINGELTAFPSVREKDIATGDYDSKITGSKYDIGIGAEIALCSLNVGMNLYYSIINMKMKDAVYADVGKNGSLKEGCLEIYVGIPIESFIEPLMPKF